MPLTELQKQYDTLLESFTFSDTREEVLTQQHKDFLSSLAGINNSGVTLFDLFLRKHIFVSYNFPDLFGYDLDKAEVIGNDYFNSKVHPDDIEALFAYGLYSLQMLQSLHPGDMNKYKMIIEYRIQGKDNNYVRIIEQHQAFFTGELSDYRLSLSVIDISPNQEPLSTVKCLFNNFTTGEYYKLPPYTGLDNNISALSKREKEVLKLISEGLLSKEISDKLSISVHTVNTHRQRILEKLGVQTSIEALSIASKLGMLT